MKNIKGKRLNYRKPFKVPFELKALQLLQNSKFILSMDKEIFDEKIMAPSDSTAMKM